MSERKPYPSLVLETGENLAYIQIGSRVPHTIEKTLTADGKDRAGLPRIAPTPKHRVAAAMLLHQYGDGYLRPELQALVVSLRADKEDPAAGKAANSVEKLLATWPQKRDRQRLLDGCVAAVLGADEGNPLRDFAWPGEQRVLAWSLMQELIYGTTVDAYGRPGTNYAYHSGWSEQPVALPEATRVKLADHCRKVVAEGADADKPYAASIIVSTAIGWARLTEKERKDLFLSTDPSVWRWAAIGLVKNGKRDQMMEWANERPAEDQLDVIWLLKHNKPKEWSEKELAFWLACADRNPGSIAYAVRSCDGPIPTEFRKPVMGYLEREIAKPTVLGGGFQPAYDLFAAIRLLDSWKNPNDTLLLLKYLEHPAKQGAFRFDGNSSTEIVQYYLRSHVRAILEARDVKIPPGVVYEEVIGPAKK